MEQDKLMKPRLLIIFALVLYAIEALFFLLGTILTLIITPDITASWATAIAGLACFGLMVYNCTTWLITLKKGATISISMLTDEIRSTIIFMCILFLLYFLILGIIQFILLLCARKSINKVAW